MSLQCQITSESGEPPSAGILKKQLEKKKRKTYDDRWMQWTLSDGSLAADSARLMTFILRGL
jgi:hypothetical protein